MNYDNSFTLSSEFDRESEQRLAAFSLAPAWKAHRATIEHVAELAHRVDRREYGPTIWIGSGTPLSQEEHGQLDHAITSLIPWRKGPFNLFGIPIEAEWIASKKWDRIKPFLPPLEGATVADVGCSNGYYLFRMLAHNPARLLGIEPYAMNYLQFCLIQALVRAPAIRFALCGVDECRLLPDTFDLILFMGVLYHQRNQLHALERIRDALKPGGFAIIETMIIPGEDPLCFVPPDRYMKMRNVWSVPTLTCLRIWLERLKFHSIEIMSTTALSSDEQRRTRHAPYESLSDFLDPQDSSRTIEGFCVPNQVLIKVQRAN